MALRAAPQALGSPVAKQSQATQTRDHHVGRDGRGPGLPDHLVLHMVQDEMRHLVLHMNLLSLIESDRSITPETERRVRQVAAGKYQERYDAHLSSYFPAIIRAVERRTSCQM